MSGHCVEAKARCVCGGDVPAIREQCGNSVKVSAPAPGRDAFEAFAHEFGMVLDRSKIDPEAYKYQYAAEGWRAWQRAFPEAVR